MTIRFAAPPGALRARLSPWAARSACGIAANDNRGERINDELLSAALRHFAGHGLAAAQHARKQAEQAFFAGDREGYDWWRGICSTLDRRMAAAIDFRGAGGSQRRP